MRSWPPPTENPVGSELGRESRRYTDVRQTPESYFVRLNVDPHPGVPDSRAVNGRAGLGLDTPASSRRHRHRRGGGGRRMLIILVVLGLGTWAAWASQQPGGISGTVNGWVKHTRGDVADVSTDPDLATARKYFATQYTQTGQYPQMSEADLATVGIGVGVNVTTCTPQAVMIEGNVGGGPGTWLLVSGHDLGEVVGQPGCPADLRNPAPWK